jgi:hypothetical protein
VPNYFPQAGALVFAMTQLLKMETPNLFPSLISYSGGIPQRLAGCSLLSASSRTACATEQVIRQHHDPVFAGHPGEKRTLSSLRLHYYWPLMSKDVENSIQRCTSCAKMKGKGLPWAPLGELPEATGPMEITSLDICGSYPISRRRHRFLLTFIDHFTRYPEAIPIPNQEAETVATALVTQVFTQHGCPQVLSSDRGTNFMSALFQEMCKLLQVKRINSTAFNPKMQRAQYDKNTKLVTFSVGDYVCLKEMAVGVGKSKKVRNRWRGPYLITKRLSDLNYQIQIKPGKHVTVNVNRLKRCYDPPKRRKDRQGTVPTTEDEQLTNGTAVMTNRFIYRAT